MKPVRLKPNSAEFADEKPSVKSHARVCDMPGCQNKGEFRAPKDRSLNDHYWFCESHIKQYNAAWNYFSGMQQDDVEKYIYESLHGMRPTRPFSDWNKSVEDLEAEIAGFRYGQDNYKSQARSGNTGQKTRRKDENTPEREALREMGLEETLDFEVIKTRYKQLAKQYHPDLNPNNAEAEDKLKRINMAYTILKMAFSDNNNTGF